VWDTVTRVSTPQYPQYPQQGGYPQHLPANPYAAPPVPDQVFAVPRPPAVTIAFWIAVVTPVLATVVGVLNLVLAQSFLNDSLSAQLGSRGLDPNSPEAQTTRKIMGFALLTSAGISTVCWIVLTVLWIVFGFKMRAGRNWARITLTVFASIWALSAVATLISAASGGTMFFMSMPANVHIPTSMMLLGFFQGAVSLVAMAAFIMLVNRQPSSAYFQAHRFH
jgi:hypothetical protein